MTRIKLSFTDDSLSANEEAMERLKECEDKLNSVVDLDGIPVNGQGGGE